MSAETLHAGGNAAERLKRERPVMIAGRGIVAFGVISIFLIFVLGETIVQKVLLVHPWSLRLHSSMVDQVACQDQLDRSSGFIPSKLLLITRPTVQEAYKTNVAHVSKLPERQARNLKPQFQTVIEPNRNVEQFGLTGVKNVCMRPDGAIVMVRISEADIVAQVSDNWALNQDWFMSYNQSQDLGGVGFDAIEDLPQKVRWVPGTTTHIIPYLGNVFHHFADRLWPHIAGFQYPLNETSPHPINHFLVHRFSTWLFQAGHNMDRNTLMYQIRILGALAPKADFLDLDGLMPNELVCYERFVLACTTCDRMSNLLGNEITKPALLRYRHAAFSYFGIREPVLPLPPRPLRVTFYARGDTTRRKIANALQLVYHLESYTNPPLVVTFVDELLASGEYNQSLPEVVSLFSQTDIFITVHGANTWAALFMPKHGGVIEIEGPCGPFSWLNIIVNAVELKHDTSNPWGAAVASPDAGNVTECDGPYETPDFTVNLHQLDAAIHQLALPTFGLNDRIPRHWLYNWS